MGLVHSITTHQLTTLKDRRPRLDGVSNGDIVRSKPDKRCLRTRSMWAVLAKTGSSNAPRYRDAAFRRPTLFLQWSGLLARRPTKAASFFSALGGIHLDGLTPRFVAALMHQLPLRALLFASRRRRKRVPALAVWPKDGRMGMGARCSGAFAPSSLSVWG